jgi:hypothetical protein
MGLLLKLRQNKMTLVVWGGLSVPAAAFGTHMYTSAGVGLNLAHGPSSTPSLFLPFLSRFTSFFKDGKSLKKV